MNTKICFKCKKNKPLSNFYRQKNMKDGHLNKCIECTKIDSNKHRADNLEHCLEYDRKRSNLPNRINARKDAYEKNKNTKKYKDQHLESNNKYRNNNPEKTKAHRKVAYHLSKGNIRKLPCSVCGDINSEAHHEDYNYPLEIIWLCKKHHKKLHRK